MRNRYTRAMSNSLSAHFNWGELIGGSTYGSLSNARCPKIDRDEQLQSQEIGSSVEVGGVEVAAGAMEAGAREAVRCAMRGLELALRRGESDSDRVDL